MIFACNISLLLRTSAFTPFTCRTLYCGLYRDLVGNYQKSTVIEHHCDLPGQPASGEQLLLNLFAKLEDKSIHIPFIFALSRENHLNSFNIPSFQNYFSRRIPKN